MNEMPDKQTSEKATTPGIWRKTWELPAYPLVAACLLTLNIFVNNWGFFPDANLLARPIVFGILIGAMLTFSLGRLLHDWHRGAFLAAILILFLSHGGFAAEATARTIGEATGFVIAPEYPLFAIFAVVAALSRYNRIRPVVTIAANIWAVLMLLANLTIWGSIWIAIDEKSAVASDIFADARASKDKPDIYHITLDGYSRADVLREEFGFDNADFLDRIRGFGFAVADRATTPYNQTRLAMLSIFDASYLQRFGEEPKVAQVSYRKRIREQFLENSVFTALARMGYRIGATHSEYPPLDIGRNDMIAPRPWFELTTLERTALDQSVLGLMAYRFAFLDPRENHSISMMRDAYNAPFTQTLERPVFLFTHQLAPHPPFNIARDGGRRKMIRLEDTTNFQNGKVGLRAEYREGYAEKLRFINNETAEHLRRLITELPDPKIVIIHGDHGSGQYLDREGQGIGCAKERFSPLLAVYSSDGLLQASLEDDFNLVNLYRLIFNTYFETGLPMLESKNYFAPYPEPFKHSPVGAEVLAKACSGPG
jgi:hypothetical protein